MSEKSVQISFFDKVKQWKWISKSKWKHP